LTYHGLTRSPQDPFFLAGSTAQPGRSRDGFSDVGAARRPIEIAPGLPKRAAHPPPKGKDKGIQMDADFGAREEKEREDAQYAKYSQNSYLAGMLLNTRNAKLVQFRRGKPPVVCDELMRVRHRLQQEKATRK